MHCPTRPSVRSLFILTTLSLLAGGCATPEQDWNVLFVTFDTTRADAIGCYGNDEAATPTLDRLAAEGFLFEHAFTAVPITLPSHSTMFTGTYPTAHGVRDNGIFKLPEGRTTLAELLKENGYATGAAIGAFPLTREFGLDQGFDFYDDQITANRENLRGQRTVERDGLFFDERPAPEVNDAILPWIREHANQPFFAWIHYWDPHQPLIPAAPYNQVFAHNLYAGEISQADHSLGRVLAELKRLDVFDRTLIVMTADHGEGHGEHNEDSHSLLLYNATLHVPMIVKVPGLAGGLRIPQRVASVDLMPTILELLDITKPQETQGRSLVPLFEAGGSDWREKPIYAETLSPRLSHGWGELRALFRGDLKYTHGPRSELFDLSVDPDELSNLKGSEAAKAEEMKDLLQAFLVRHQSDDAADSVQEVDESTRQRLAALGYISGGGAGADTIVEELRTDGIPPQDRIRDISLSSRTKQSLDRRHYLEAREMATELVRREPTSGYYRGLLALAHFGLGQIDEAARLAEDTDTVVSQNDGIFLQVARRLFGRGDRARGLELAKKLVASHPTAYGHYLLGEMQFALRNDAERVAQLEQALALEPGHDLTLMSLAVHHGEAGDFERAEALLRQLLDHHPFHGQGHFNLAVLLLRDDRYADARALLERALRLDPSYCQAHLALLALDTDLGETDAAQARYDLLQTRCPDPATQAHAESLMSPS